MHLALIQNQHFMSTIGIDVVSETLETKINVKLLKIFQMTLSKKRWDKKGRRKKVGSKRKFTQKKNSKFQSRHTNFAHTYLQKC